jgi:hypothetical protein
MKKTADWSMKTVGAFLGAVPWQGSHIVPLTAPILVAQSCDWRSQSVRAFFSRIAWDGQQVQDQTASAVFQPLSYLRPVQEFFCCFAWKGQPNIGAIPPLGTRATKVPELSLDDLSDLF